MSAPELKIDEAAIRSDLLRCVADVQPEASDGPLQIWRGFLAHANRPLAYGDRFERHPHNDQLRFVVRRTTAALSIDIERRVGVVLDEDYEGTIIARCRLTVEPDSAWDDVADAFGIEGYGPTGDGVDAFREDVEASAAFAAFIQSRVRSFRTLAHYG